MLGDSGTVSAEASRGEAEGWNAGAGLGSPTKRRQSKDVLWQLRDVWAWVWPRRRHEGEARIAYHASAAERIEHRRHPGLLERIREDTARRKRPAVSSTLGL